MYQTGATLSECGTYRYALWRIWREDYPLLGFLMLNPSTADASKDDPTITRCIRRAEQGAYGGVIAINLFAYRATDPKALKSIDDPVGPLNDVHIVEQARRVDVLICAWGTHGVLHDRNRSVLQLLAREAPGKAHYLALTKAGHPRHPLYVGYDCQPVPWDSIANPEG